MYRLFRDKSPASQKGNPDNGYGPAAVTGNENCKCHCSNEREGAVSRKIRKSEDLPVYVRQNSSKEKKGGNRLQVENG